MQPVYLCHLAEDARLARILGYRLGECSIETLLVNGVPGLGGKPETVIGGARPSKPNVAVLLSRDAVRSRSFMKKLESVLVTDPEANVGFSSPIVVQAGKCAIPPFLAGCASVDFSAWKESGEDSDFEGPFHQLVRLLGGDPADSQRFHGSRMIRRRDLIAKLVENFRPRPVIVENFCEEDDIHFVRVDNEDGTFELYERWSKPSLIDLLNKLFRRAGDPPIVDLVYAEAIAFTETERTAAVAGIYAAHGIPEEEFWKDTVDKLAEDMKDAWTRARREYGDWCVVLSLVCQQDSNGSSDG